MSKTMQHRVEYFFYVCAGILVRLLPFAALHHVASVLTRMAYPLLKSRRRVALRNLQNAYPEKNLKELEAIAYASFQSVAAALLEILWYPRLTKEHLERCVNIENLELLEQTLRQHKGCIFLTAHYGSWELAVHRLSISVDVPCIAIEKVQANASINKIIHADRIKFGMNVVSMEQSAREVMKVLRQGGLAALAADQAAAKESVAVEFFGRKVPTFQGPAVFSVRTGAPILVGLAVRQRDGTYAMRLHKVQSDDLTDQSEETIAELTRRHTKLTEELIREHPEQWMWMHKRWKHAADRVEMNC